MKHAICADPQTQSSPTSTLLSVCIRKDSAKPVQKAGNQKDLLYGKSSTHGITNTLKIYIPVPQQLLGRSRELDSMIPMGSFQLEILYGAAVSDKGSRGK